MRKNIIDRRTALRYFGIAAMGGMAGCIHNQRPNQNKSDEDDHLPNENGDTNDGHAHDEGEIEGKSESAIVNMVTNENGYHNEPHVVWIEKGGTVTWVNKSGNHTATAYHPDNQDKPLRIPRDADSWGSGLLTEKDATYERSFDVEGVYDYYCEPHEEFGMIGSVIVGEPDPHEQLGLEPPQGELPEGARQKIGDLNHIVEDILAELGEHEDDEH